MRAVTLYGYAGSGALGVRRAGFRIVASLEGPEAFGVEQVRVNADELDHPLTAEGEPGALPLFPNIDMLYGNPACAGFSVQNRRHSGVDSPSNLDLRRFWQYAARLRPPVVVMESVPRAFTNGWRLMRELTPDGYELEHVLMTHEGVGGAQRRRRYFAVAHRLGRPFETDSGWLGEPSTPRQVLAGVAEAPDHVWLDTPYARRRSEVSKHAAPGESLRAVARRLAEEDPQLLERIDGVKPYERGSGTNWLSVNRKVPADRPTPAVTGTIELFHFAEPRPLSIREVARLMGLPDTWRINPSLSIAAAWARLGKNVPVQSAEWMARQAFDNLTGEAFGMEGVEHQAGRLHRRDRQPVVGLEQGVLL